MSNSLEASFVGLIGATGTGKSTKLKKRLAKIPKAKQKRTFVWSPKEDEDNYAALYPNSIICTTAAQVKAVLEKAGRKGSFHIVYKPTLNRKKDEAAFHVVCLMLLAVGMCILIVDELHTVTTPTRAPDGWTKLCFMGRAKGLEVFGMSTRPASVDKGFMSSLSELSVARMSYPEDQKNMAQALGLNHLEVSQLFGYQSIERNFKTGEVKRIGYKLALGKDGEAVKVPT